MTMKGWDVMTCHDLAANIEAIHPEAMPQDVARLCLLLTNTIDDLDQITNREELDKVWQDMGLKLQAATDQHAAMTDEMQRLASSNPREFTEEQIWVLIRAIKVQSQILQMYVGKSEIDIQDDNDC